MCVRGVSSEKIKELKRNTVSIAGFYLRNTGCYPPALKKRTSLSRNIGICQRKTILATETLLRFNPSLPIQTWVHIINMNEPSQCRLLIR